MKKYFLFACVAAALVSCSSDEFLGENPELTQKTENDGAILFKAYNGKAQRADKVGADAATTLGNNFFVEGTKGTEATNAPSSTVVFDNYLVHYAENTAGNTESNTNNWEYVGQEKITENTYHDAWTALHNSTSYPSSAQAQTIKYWDYSTDQYDFIAYSTGTAKPVTSTPSEGEVKVSRIATGTGLATNAYQFTANSVAALNQIYVTDINTVKKENYGKVVSLKFKNLAAKVRVGVYETVPGYAIKDVHFYLSEGNSEYTYETVTVASGASVANYYKLDGSKYVKCGSSETADGSTTYYKRTALKPALAATPATLFSAAEDIPQSGTVTVFYPNMGTSNQSNVNYNKVNVNVAAGATKTDHLQFGALSNFASSKEGSEAAGSYIGRTLPTATFAGTGDYYTTVIPVGAAGAKVLTLRCDYTLTSIDGSGETINVYGAKATVPATYTAWQPNYAYTYIFKITDGTNGWTSTTLKEDGTPTDPSGLFPITFDAVVAENADAIAEQTTITTVATPTITTYQQGHTSTTDEYDNDNGNIYVQVMDNSTSPATLKGDLKDTGKSLLFTLSADASEAMVLDALENRSGDYAYDAETFTGRNNLTLTNNTNINNNVDKIINGVNGNAISITAGQAALITTSALSAGSYAYVYVNTAASADEKLYHCVTPANDTEAAKYYEVAISALTTVSGTTAEAGKVYFVKNSDDSYTFKPTKVGDDVTGLYEGTIPSSKATAKNTESFYFDVYNHNNGSYAVKVIKVVE